MSISFAMSADEPIAAVALIVVLGMMLGELALSRSHEAVLRARGAVEPSGDVYRQLAWAYPLAFVAMAVESVGSYPHAGLLASAGLLVLIAAKGLKGWAIWWLGPRWSFRVLVLPDTPLVTGGPYAWVRHPNYLAVFGEIAGFALFVGAAFSGIAALAAFAVLIRKRIAVEERALRPRA